MFLICHLLDLQLEIHHFVGLERHYTREYLERGDMHIGYPFEIRDPPFQRRNLVLHSFDCFNGVHDPIIDVETEFVYWHLISPFYLMRF